MPPSQCRVTIDPTSVDFHDVLGHCSTLHCPRYVVFSGNKRGLRQSTRAGKREALNLSRSAAEINSPGRHLLAARHDRKVMRRHFAPCGDVIAPGFVTQ